MTTCARLCLAILFSSLLVPPVRGQDGERWDVESALARVPERTLPPFWYGGVDGIARRLDDLERGAARVIAVSPGGRPIQLVAYGRFEPVSHRANFNSAMGARAPGYYMDKAAREKPVVLFIGPVHGQEVEGLTGLMNLVEIMETGRDLRGRDQSALRALGDRARLLIIPTGNPDGVARFLPGALQGMAEEDVAFWGQGTWNDGTLIGWPEAKQLHPMAGDTVGFVGCYFDDDGVNPMHDEFYRPMGPEAPAILEVARREGPDIAVSLHSHAWPPAILRPAFVPLSVQRQTADLGRAYKALLEARGLPAQADVFEPQPEEDVATLNLTSAVYHVSGALSFTHECPHGVEHHSMPRVLTFEELLDVQLTLYESILRYALERKQHDGRIAH